MNPFHRATRPRRHLQLQPGAEALETRSLLTGGAGNTFAIIPGTISKPGDTVSVSFTIDSSHFTLPHHKMALGIDVVPDPSGTLKPLISSVTAPNGDVIPQTFHSIYDPHVSHRQVANGVGTSAVITPIKIFPENVHSNTPETFTVQVTAESKSTGSFLLGFYLPGDANGDGKVNQADLKLVKSERGARAGSNRYTFDADVNRDGRIGKIDIAYTLQNQGVSTNITPVVGANLVPTSVTDPANRSTTGTSAKFTGVASPGATIIYTNTNAPGSPPVTTTADSTGHYTVTTPLVRGQNVFRVKSTDAFGQTISGNIAGVTSKPKT